MKDVEAETKTGDHAEMLKLLRRKVVDSKEDLLPPLQDTNKKSAPRPTNSETNNEKSIYSDNSEEEQSYEEAKIELKPGLNILVCCFEIFDSLLLI